MWVIVKEAEREVIVRASRRQDVKSDHRGVGTVDVLGHGRMKPESALMLDDSLNQRIVLTWHLVPLDVRMGSSIYDMASYSARVAGCDVDEAAARIAMLLDIGIIYRSGYVDQLAAGWLARKVMASMRGMAKFDTDQITASFVSKMEPDELKAWLKDAAPQLEWEE